MSRAEVDRIVREVLSTVLDRRIEAREDVRRAQEPKWDSLAHVNIVFSVEGELGIQLEAGELETVDTVDKLVDTAYAHLTTGG